MKELVNRLTSRKLFAALVAAFVASLGEQLGLGDREVQSIVTFSTAFIIGQGIEGVAAPLRGFVDRFKSRKLWMFVGLSVLAAFSQEVGIDPQILDMLSVYFVGQGISDFGKWRRKALQFETQFLDTREDRTPERI